jgi:hypothetical protein
LKFIKSGQIRVEDIPAFSFWVGQESSIAEKEHVLSAAPKAFPREWVHHRNAASTPLNT